MKKKNKKIKTIRDGNINAIIVMKLNFGIYEINHYERTSVHSESELVCIDNDFAIFQICHRLNRMHKTYCILLYFFLLFHASVCFFFPLLSLYLNLSLSLIFLAEKQNFIFISNWLTIYNLRIYFVYFGFNLICFDE